MRFRTCAALLSGAAVIAAVAPDVRAQPSAAHPVRIAGTVETYIQWDFARPFNGVSNYRGADGRDETFTLSLVELDVRWDDGASFATVTLQAGSTPAAIYLSEPVAPATSGAPPLGPDTWRVLQEGYAGVRWSRFEWSAGLFLSPVGPEGVSALDHWNWSRSNLFLGLPSYHTGTRLRVGLSDAWSLKLAAVNGWNSVVDGNREKSFIVQAGYTPAVLALSLLYCGGVERPPGAAEGRAWRHLVDAHVTWQATSALALAAHLDAGAEPNQFGTSAWAAAALYARVKLATRAFLAARVDGFRESRAHDAHGTAATIFWPGAWVAEGTVTLELLPVDRLHTYLEFRHDSAAVPQFFGRVDSSGALAGADPTQRTQNTITLGLGVSL